MDGTESWTEHQRLLIGLYLLICNWSRKKLAARAGVSRGALSRHERGHQKAQRWTRERYAAATRVPLVEVEALLPDLHRLCAMAEGRSAPAAAADVPRRVGSVVERTLRREEPYLPLPEPAEPAAPALPPHAAERMLAEELWVRLKVRSHSARLALVEEAPRYWSWALAEKLCAESVKAAAGHPGRALKLAELALRVAEKVAGEEAGEEAWLSLLLGYVWAHVGNARRVANGLPDAEEAFRLAWSLWEAGSAADSGLLDGSRLLDLEASLLRDQRKMAAALERLDRALAMHLDGAARGRVLLKKGATLEQMGEWEAAVETLQQAAPWIDSREREPRNFCVLRFNLNAALSHLGRYEEVEGSPRAARSHRRARPGHGPREAGLAGRPYRRRPGTDRGRDRGLVAGAGGTRRRASPL